MKKRYPLEPLVALRRERAEQRARELGEAERRVLGEKAALEGARQKRVSAETRARKESETERERLEAGLERAQDLVRGELHRVRERLRVEALSGAERRAEKAAETAERALGAARSALGVARADARALSRQKERFQRAAERDELSAEDEAAEEFHAVVSRRRED